MKCFIIAGLCMVLAPAVLAGQSQDSIELSDGLLELLRSEMREITGGMQSIPVSLASGDWHAVHETAGKIAGSYILKQSITPEQLEELKQALPAGFRQIDQSFHHRAQKLAEAARNRDAEGVAFQYSRMMENCTQCHSQYASGRFPGFTVNKPEHDH